MANKYLTKAKINPNDEFYTQYMDIEKEIKAYIHYDRNLFRDKTVLLPCDDPEWSNFTKYFALHFEQLGIKRLISTSYAPDSKSVRDPYWPSLFETESPRFDPKKTQVKGKIFILDRDVDGNGKIDINDLQWDYLEGDGDFRSEEIKKLRDEADIIITNPPFSIFKQFFAWIVESQKKFLIICNKTCVTYKEVFPHIKDNKVWVGTMRMGTDILFKVPDEIAKMYVEKEKEGSKYRIVDGVVLGRSASCWITNIDHGYRHEEKNYMTMEQIKRYSKHKDLEKKGAFLKYENYDAIEIPYSDAIPSDYDGIMGVPLSYLDKHCPEQYEILGMCENEDLYKLKTRIYSTSECKQAYIDKFKKKGTYDLNASAVLILEGIRHKSFQRILIRKIKHEGSRIN